MTPFWGRIYRGIGYSVATFIIVYATLVNVATLLTPYLNEHKTDFEKWGSQLLKTPISIEHVAVAWSRFEPEIELANVNILNKDTHKPTFAIRRVNVNFQVLRSLFTWQPQVESIKIAGVQLTVHEFKAGQFHIEGLRDITITDNFTGASMNSDTVLAWIFSVSHLTLRAIDIRYIPEQGEQRSITLDRLALSNDDKHHQLTGLAIFNQDVPTKVDINLVWNGDFSDISHINADLGLYIEGVSLLQFLKGKSWHQLEIQEGLGSAKINLHWDNDQIQKVHAQVQIYELEIKSLASQKVQLFSRISGNIDWQHQGDNQTLSGSEILIDFPDHLWPTTSFSLNYTPTAEGDYILNSVDVSYMNIADIKQLALDSGFISSEEIKKNIVSINPKGEIRGLHAKSSGQWNDPAMISLSAEFSELDIAEWKKLPGITNLLGSISWDGKQGALKLNSRQTKISLSSVFAKPLPFNQLSGYLTWNKDEKNNWILNAKNIFIVNPDARIQATASLTLPEKDSPSINFTSTFSVSNVANIPKYMPAKVMDPELVSWLKQALQGGSIEYAKADMHGKFSDFASGNPAALLQVSGILKNIDLNYAPKWPALRDIEGKIKFTGQEMTFDVTNATISGAPVKQLHATLDHFSDKDPTVLNLQAHIQSTLDQGEQFLRDSPLNDVFGKELRSMQLHGPMDLTLGLSLPVKKPEEIKVQGSINTTDANLNLQEWNLALTQLQGKFQFSEQDIQATNMQARLFDEPISLSFSTKHPPGKASFVIADINGAVDMEVIKKWLNMASLTDYLRGKTNYKAELHLASHDKNQANEIILTSDLKGVSVTLPEQYGKKVEDTRDFRLDVLAAQNQPLKIKMDYGKLLSAAVMLKNQQQKWQIQSGELRLGSGANWQTKPGILISGHIDVLDWEKLQKEFSAQKTTTTISPTELFSTNASGFTIREVNLNIGTLHIFDHEFKNMDISIEKSKSAWELGLNSEIIRGDVTIPFDTDQEAITCRFDHVYFKSSNSEIKSKLDPKKIPAISFVGDDVRIDEKSFGRVRFETVPSGSGMIVKEFNMKSKNLELHATGYWQATRNGDTTNFRGEASTKKLSDLLTAWGFNSTNFVAGVSDVKFDLSWPNAPFNPTEKGLSGKLSLHLGEGRVVDVGDNGAKMGLGRMLSLFSLQTIPRRLSLDFSDLFEKGYSFDSMNANFNFKNGNAFTDDMRFDGPVAEIVLAGRIGLVAKDFDIKLGVTPHMTSSLPVVATFAAGGFNPIAGAIAWAFDKVISSRSVSSVTTYQYRITGPWDKPSWNQMSGKQ